ncbi:meiosis regulator and mRNA stability factor 1 isoform X2 [Ischnura elegans]|uniref:meiosis regulator and mRNA stability factor 1 isoform X2 n=1 Tax=Ischnura elegans TaxID=197161 RepID=UPI001ED8BBFB|nr:meiosis regulator and mRNA stability factor 1 isoform X2 [Ischnura elegans]
MSQQPTFKRPKPPSRKVEACFFNENNGDEDRPRIGSGLYFPTNPSSTTFRCLSASPFTKSDRDSESSSQQDEEDCGLMMSFTPSSPVCVPCYRYHNYQSNGSPVALRSLPRFLPPIGVFWDIENCQVPKGRSAMAVAQVIRDRFFTGYREAEFLVVCDVKKENSQVIQELNDAQVNLIHVSATCKNAADEKLRQAIRRFADIHGSPASIILISGDINFAADICDLRHRKKIHVILLHKVNTSEALILCASENYNFTHIVESLPPRTQSKFPTQPVEVVISNLPDDKDETRIRNRLKQLSDNCGGRVGSINKTSASIRFPSLEIAHRAKKRMDGEDVFGNKISVSSPTKGLERKEGSPVKLQSLRKITGRKEELPKDLRPLVSSSRLEDRAHEVKLYGHNGWHSCPNVQWPVDRETEDNSLTKLRGLPCPSGKPSNGLGPLPSPTMPVIPPPPMLWHAVPSHWVNSNCEDTKKSSTAAPIGKSNPCEDRETVPRGVIGRNSDSWLPNKLPDGRRKIRGTHRVSQSEEATEDMDPFKGADSIMLKTSVGNENAFSLSHIQQQNAIPKRSRTPSPLTANEDLHRPSNQYFPRALPKMDRNSSKAASSEMSAFNCRTPSPHIFSLGTQEKEMWSHGNVTNWMSGGTSWQSSVRSSSPVSSHKTTESDNPEHYFHPIHTVQSGVSGSIASSSGNGSFSPVELQVTNLDQDIDAKDMKRILLSVFREHVMVLHVSVFIQSDGNFAASVKVPSLQDAQYAISQLHRRRVGFKRICISYANSGGPNPQLIRSQIVSLLLEVPGHRLPLFKFRELFESRYLTSVSVSDLHRMKDVIIVTEDSNGRMVLLNPDHRNTPSPISSNDGPVLDYPYCMLHSKKTKPEKGWAEQEIDVLPNIMVGMKLFGQRIHNLLHSHDGIIPLPSLPDCYLAEFQELEANEDGVPLEHLLTCVKGVEIHQGSSGIKVLRWRKNSNTESVHSGDSVKCVSPPLISQLALFSRELVDLLKRAPHCQLPFNRFIPAYHHHFGRQCRVADYGFTKLIELLEAVPQIVQVMGDGGRRIVTLSHRAQVRRFTSDLLRILKSQANKQVALSTFPSTYEKVIGQPFHAPDYGVCYLEDILVEVSENTVVLTTDPSGLSTDVIISVPKREQTPNEIEKTKQFALEVVELLRHAPQCSLLFNKFIPAYHHHFGHQCRVADYGFTKLIELFEAIPEVAKIEETAEGERRVMLTVKERLKVLAEQMKSLVQSSGWTLNQQNKGKKTCSQKGTPTQQGPPPSLLPLSAIPSAFLRQNGYALHCEDFDCDSLEQLMRCISNTVEVIDSPWGPLLSLVDQGVLYQLELQVRCILLSSPNGRKTIKDFISLFTTKYPGQHCNAEVLRKEMSHVVELKVENHEDVIMLTPLEVFGQELLILLGESPGHKMTLASLEYAYLEHFGVAACPARLGFPSLAAAIHALHKTVSLRGRGQKRIIFVNPELTGIGLQLPLNLTEAYGISREKNICDEIISDEQDNYPKNGENGLKSFNHPTDGIVADMEHFAGRSDSDSPPKQFSCDWPQVPTPHVQASVPSQSSVSIFPPQPLSYSIISPCPVVPPDPSELPLPLLGPSRSGDASPMLSAAVENSSSVDVGSSVNTLSPASVIGSGNPTRRRMMMKAQFDSPLLLPQ